MAQVAGDRFEELLAALRSEHAQLRLRLPSSGVEPSQLQTSSQGPAAAARAWGAPGRSPRRDPEAEGGRPSLLEHGQAARKESGPVSAETKTSSTEASSPDACDAKQAEALSKQLPGCAAVWPTGCPARASEGHDEALRQAADCEASTHSSDGSNMQPRDDASEQHSGPAFELKPQRNDKPSTSLASQKSVVRSYSVLERAKTNFTELFAETPELFPAPSEEVEDRSRLQEIVSSPLFELLWIFAIFANTFVMAAEAQCLGLQVAYDRNYEASGASGDVWASAAPTFEALNLVFGVLFSIELLLRLAASRCQILHDRMIWVDIVSVLIWSMERILPGQTSFNAMMIRVARMLRLARFVRIVRFLNAFQKLYLLVQSIKSSFQALLWSSAVLFLVEFMIALVINISLADYLQSSDAPLADREELFKYYGTFAGALLTQFEMLLGNWYTITRVLLIHSEVWAIYGVIHQLCLGFAVVEVITGVLIRETFQVASLDDGVMTAEHQLAVKMNSAKLRAFFSSADFDGNGLLDERNLKEVLQRDRVREWLSAMGLEVADVADAFHLFDVDGSGAITLEEFVNGALSMRGPARATEMRKIHTKLDWLLAHVVF